MRVEEPGGPDAVSMNLDHPVYQVNIYERLDEPAGAPEEQRAYHCMSGSCTKRRSLRSSNGLNKKPAAASTPSKLPASFPAATHISSGCTDTTPTVAPNSTIRTRSLATT